MRRLVVWFKALSASGKAGVILAAFIGIGVVGAAGQSPTNNHPSKPSTPPTPQATKPDYTAEDVASALNGIREAHGLPDLKEDTALLSAAQARADEMVADNIRDNSSGDPASLLSSPDANYPAGRAWSLQSTWANSTAQQAAQALAQNQAFGLGNGFLDMGIGLSSYNGGSELLVAAFLGDPPNTQSNPINCTPLTNGGNCYEPGEYCRNSDHGASGIAGDGKSITCAYNNGWRWEPN